MIDLSLLGMLILVAIGIWGVSLFVTAIISNDGRMVVAHAKLDTLISSNDRRFFSVDDFNCQRPLVNILLKYQDSEREAYTLLEDLSHMHEISPDIDAGDLEDWQKYVNAFLDTTADRSNPLRF